MISKTLFLVAVIAGASVALADINHFNDGDAPSISPADDVCGDYANKTTCSSFVDWDALDPALLPMLLPNDKVFYAYVQPDVSTFYQARIPDESKRQKLREVKPYFNGMAGRFVNMSPNPMLLMWVSDEGDDADTSIAYVEPFDIGGTATYPGHTFCMTLTDDNKKCVKMFHVTEGVLRYTYDPFVEDPENFDLLDLTFDELEKYQLLERSEDFSRRYKTFTGQDYLSNYPRSRASHYMYPADYFDQTHTVESQETHFIKMPPKEFLGHVSNHRSSRKLMPNEPRHLQEYRSPEASLIMTLTVLSCAPRVFEIKNFLSDVEADHFLDLAGAMELLESRVGESDFREKGEVGDKLSLSSTRTSKNTWVTRETSPIIDVVYRRAADLLHIDEALLRHRSSDEFPNVGSSLSIAESLQLVHYDPGQEYNAHHDFGYPPIKNKYQATRFATILLYLNEGMEGGETAFPRWVNAETGNQLLVKPEKGKAVLFYNFLPDGNLDDLSQHAALPVIKGEKWLTNLWIWDPIYEAD